MKSLLFLSMAGLLLFPTAATAADIEVDFTVVTIDFSEDEPIEVTTHQSVTFNDVVEGRQAGILVEGPTGRFRIEMDVSLFFAEQEGQSDQVQYDLEIWAHASGRTGKDKSKLISSPRLRANTDQPALVKQGASIPVDGPDGVEWLEPSIEIEVRWVE